MRLCQLHWEVQSTEGVVAPWRSRRGGNSMGKSPGWCWHDLWDKHDTLLKTWHVGGKNPHEWPRKLGKNPSQLLMQKHTHKYHISRIWKEQLHTCILSLFQSCACRFNGFEVGYEWANFSWFQQSLGSSSLTPKKCRREKSAFFRPTKAPGGSQRQTKEVQPELVVFFRWQIIPSNFCDSNQASATGERAWLPPVAFSGMSTTDQSSSEFQWVMGKKSAAKPMGAEEVFFTNKCHISVLYFEEHELWSFQQNPLTVPAEALFGTIWSYLTMSSWFKVNYSPAIEHGNQDWKQLSILYIDIYMYISTNELWICPWANFSFRRSRASDHSQPASN